MPVGYLSFYSNYFRNGVISSPEMGNKEYNFDDESISPHYTEMVKGDKVTFEIIKIHKDSYKIANISLVQHTALQGLRSDMENKKLLMGLSRRRNGITYVINNDYLIFIRLINNKINSNETNELPLNTNEIINYRISSLKPGNEIRAEMVNRIDINSVVEVGETGKAIILNKNKMGYDLLFEYKSKGYLPQKVLPKELIAFENGETIDVYCVTSDKTNGNYIFDLFENMESRNQRIKNKLEKINNLKPGDVLQSQIARITTKTVIVSSDEIKIQIFPKSFINNYKAPNDEYEARALQQFLRKFFEEKKELQIVIVSKNNNTNVIADMDVSKEENKNLIEEINLRYIEMIDNL